MSDTVEIPIPDFAADGSPAKRTQRATKSAAASIKATPPDSAALAALSLNSALAEIESTRLNKSMPRKSPDKAKRRPPKYVRKRP